MQLSFEPIDINKQNAYREKLARCAQIASDYSFINLWSWGAEYGLQWAWIDDLVWIRQTIPTEILWAPVGDWSDAKWSSILETVSMEAPEQRFLAGCGSQRALGLSL